MTHAMRLRFPTLNR
ncbi:erythromycin resistance leader peptide [Bacillus sp. T33-2]